MDLRPVFPYDNTVDQTNYYWFQHGFSSEEVDGIVEATQNYPYAPATIVGNDPEGLIRKSQIKWLPFDDTWGWVYDRVTNQVVEANNALWKFDLNYIPDHFQYTEYNGDGGHYDWHTDIGPANIGYRKVSVVIQLSDPSDHEGGDLELHPTNVSFAVPRSKGAVILFPSFMLHRVTPLTSGFRRSLVLWVGGDHYK